MTRAQFENYLKAPKDIAEKGANELKELLQEFPYFQTARMLYVKSLYEARSIAFEENLGLMAAYSADRKALYYFLHPGRAISKSNNVSETTPAALTVTDEVAAQPKEETTVNKETEVVFPAPFRLDSDQPAGDTDDLTTSYLHEIVGSSSPFDLEQVGGGTVEEKEAITTHNKSAKEQQSELTNERHDFSTWLHIFDEPQENQNADQEDLIEQFLLRNPQMRSKQQKDVPAINLAKQSAVDKEEIITETLAKIYLNQGNVAKALSIYEKLSLRFPEKSSYFAAQIKILKQKLH